MHERRHQRARGVQRARCCEHTERRTSRLTIIGAIRADIRESPCLLRVVVDGAGVGRGVVCEEALDGCGLVGREGEVVAEAAAAEDDGCERGERSLVRGFCLGDRKGEGDRWDGKRTFAGFFGLGARGEVDDYVVAGLDLGSADGGDVRACGREAGIEDCAWGAGHVISGGWVDALAAVACDAVVTTKIGC